METGVCQILTTETVMAAKSNEGSLTLSGVPPEAVKTIAHIAIERGMTQKELYSQIARDFVSAAKKGEQFTYISTLRGSTRKTIWVDPDIADEIDELCKSINRTRSSVIITAIHHYLSSIGRAQGF